MRPVLLLVAVLCAVAAAAVVARAGDAGDATGFRTPDAGAACRLVRTALVCSSLGSPGSVSLRPDGRATVVDAPAWWDAATPVLDTWSRGGLSCRLAAEAILCRAGTTGIRAAAGGFAVAR